MGKGDPMMPTGKNFLMGILCAELLRAANKKAPMIQYYTERKKGGGGNQYTKRSSDFLKNIILSEYFFQIY